MVAFLNNVLGADRHRLSTATRNLRNAALPSDPEDIATSPVVPARSTLAAMPASGSGVRPEASVESAAAAYRDTADAFAGLATVREALQGIPAGWKFERVLAAFSPLMVVELHRQRTFGSVATGQPAYWFFNRAGSLLGTSIDAVPDGVIAHARALFAMTMTAVAGGDAVVRESFRTQFFSMPRGLRLNLMRRMFIGSPLSPLSLISPPLTGTDQDIPRLMLQQTAGSVSLVIDGLIELPIMFRDRILENFGTGWQPIGLVTLLTPFLIIELEHEYGARATWVLDQRLNQLCDHLDHATLQARIREVGPMLLRRYWQWLFELRDTPPDHVLAPLLRLSVPAATAIVRICRDLVFHRVEDMHMEQAPELLVLPPQSGAAAGLLLPRDLLRAAVRHDLYRAAIHAIRHGRFVWPSPVDGSDAELEGIIVPHEYTIFYQFRDRNGLRFLVIGGDRHCRQVGLLIPSANLAIGETDLPDLWFDTLVGADIWTVLLEHCLVWNQSLRQRQRRPDSPISNVFMARPLLHIGHYVWNDLPGQQAIIEDVPDRIPTSIIIGGAGGQGELFGPIDQLFPMLDGHVNRSIPSKDAFIRWAYESGTVPVRLTRDRVTRSLRETIRRYVQTTDAPGLVELELSRHPGTRMIIVVGLRLEDRTFMDPEAFFTGLLDHLARYHPGTLAVFDGRNSKPGGGAGEMIAGMTDHLAAIPPSVTEQALVDRLMKRFDGSGIAIVSAIGASVGVSLEWCDRADLCVALWGAGLAKYRWLANLPSLILTSRHSLETRTDLDIYHAPRWMEEPTPVLFPAPRFVTDHQNRGGLANPGGDADRACFEVDMAHVYELLERLIAM